MPVVNGRGSGDQEFEWGVSGYVYHNTFILYDRATESLWYPMSDTAWTAVAGPRQGEVIPFITEPGLVTLGAWRKEHPNTVVLLGDRKQFPEG